MSVGEQRSAGGQPVNVGRLCLRMTTQATKPVVLIIDRDKQNIRLVGREQRLRRNDESGQYQTTNRKGHTKILRIVEVPH